MHSLTDHVLRTFAAVPFGDRVLDLDCHPMSPFMPLVQLGFEVHGCSTDLQMVTACRDALQGLYSFQVAQERIVHVPRLEALGYPDAYFDWVVAYEIVAEPIRLRSILLETRRVLKSGGWIYLAVATSDEHLYTADSLIDLMQTVDLAVAESPVMLDEEGITVVRGIFRRVDDDTPL